MFCGSGGVAQIKMSTHLLFFHEKMLSLSGCLMSVIERCASDSLVPLNFELVIQLMTKSTACFSPISCKTEFMTGDAAS
jgi:hypothetical protein